MNLTGQLVPSTVEVILKKRPHSYYPRVVATGKPGLCSGWLSHKLNHYVITCVYAANIGQLSRKTLRVSSRRNASTAHIIHALWMTRWLALRSSYVRLVLALCLIIETPNAENTVISFGLIQH